MTERAGGCLCGAVRYTVSGDPLRTMNCHCRNCQKTSGSALSTIALFPRNALSVEGQTKRYEYAGDSGNHLAINFCVECGSPVILDIETMPDLVSIKVGTFDDPNWFTPQVDIWTDSAQSWFPLDDSRPGFGTNPTR